MTLQELINILCIYDENLCIYIKYNEERSSKLNHICEFICFANNEIQSINYYNNKLNITILDEDYRKELEKGE